MPKLTTITDTLSLKASSLTNLSLPLLTTINGSFLLNLNPNLHTLSLAALQTLNTSDIVTINSNPLLTNISLPTLETLGSLTVSNNSVLSTFHLPKLRTIDGDLRVKENPLLLSIKDFSQFQEAGGFLEFKGNFSE